MLNNRGNLHFEIHNWNVKRIFYTKSVLFDLKIHLMQAAKKIKVVVLDLLTK